MNPHNQPLINKDDIRIYKQISNTVPDEILNPCILSSQRGDILPLLGKSLYNDVVRNRLNHNDLLNGGDYTVDGQTYYHSGLKAVLSVYSYARYSYLGGVTDTPIGMHVMLNGKETSAPISEATKKSLWALNRQEALDLWQEVLEFMLRTEYPLYFTGCEEKTGNNDYLRITLID